MAQKNLLGQNILGYNVTELLGAGAFGTVYKIEKTNASGKYVRALKHITIPSDRQYSDVLNSMGGDVSKADDYFAEMLKGIVSEIQILNDLSEKGISNIVRYYENEIVTQESPRRYDIYIMMEYLEPLEDFIAHNDFTVRDVVKLGVDVLSGLSACHDNGVIHRDIKDDNIFVSSSGEYKIGDFGVSKVLKNSSKAESLKGTPNFLAPEVYLGKESYTKSVDLYSLGIVLYRLLNYSRNPFLPKFPEQYYANDEDAAFEKRMNGEVPELPSLGGDSIGNVVVKAISDKITRFQTASEFLTALKNAENATNNETLSEKIKFTATYQTESTSGGINHTYGITIGENQNLVSNSTTDNNSIDYSANRHLFDTIGENSNPSASNNQTNEEIRESSSNEIITPIQTDNRRVVDVIPSSEDIEPDEAEPLDKNIIGALVYIAPVIILLIGLVVYFTVIPDTYGRVISFFDLLFSDSESIIKSIRDPNVVLPQVHRIIFMKIFWWCWLGLFIASLFFLGKRLQSPPMTVATNAVLVKKQPYETMLDVVEFFSQLKSQSSTRELNDLILSLKQLQERLYLESDFGYGKNTVINCENNIAKQLQYLVRITRSHEPINIADIENSLNTINSLLRKRNELKKRH